MNAEQFTATAISILRSAVGWQSAIARRLGVNDRTVRRWLEEGTTPDWVDAKLGEMIGAADRLPWPRDEWVLGQSPTPDGRLREYIIHLQRPRFVARVVECDENGLPAPGEEPADLLSGVVYVADDAADGSTVLCEIEWIDDVDPGEVTQLLEAAADAIEAMQDFSETYE